MHVSSNSIIYFIDYVLYSLISHLKLFHKHSRPLKHQLTKCSKIDSSVEYFKLHLTQVVASHVSTLHQKWGAPPCPNNHQMLTPIYIQVKQKKTSI